MRCCIPAMVLLAPYATAWSQPAIEISEDGRRTALMDAAHEEDTAWVRRGSSIPFPLTPDRSIVLRRQIGGLEVVDVNKDDLADVVAVCYISNSFPPYEDWHDMIFMNTGGDIETTPSWISTEQIHTGDVEVGDVDQDQRLDIVTIHGGLTTAPARIYFGGPSGPSMTHGWSSSTPQSVWGTSGLLVDLDQDTFLELVTTSQGISPQPYRPMYVFNNIAGSLETVPSWESAEDSIQNGLDAADYDNDGWTDVAVAKWVDFESAIYRNVSGTLQTTPVWTVGTDGTDKGAAFADVDGNGWTDVAIGGDPARLWSNTAPGALTETWSSTAEFSGPQDFRFHDVDGDGDQDLAEIHFSTGRCHIYQNNAGVLDSAPSWTFDASEVGTALAFGDINGDGRDDLITGYSGNTCIRVFFAIPPDCPADLAAPFGSLDFFDVLGFLSLFDLMDERADLAAPSGVFDFFDVLAYLTAFDAGCP